MILFYQVLSACQQQKLEKKSDTPPMRGKSIFLQKNHHHHIARGYTSIYSGDGILTDVYSFMLLPLLLETTGQFRTLGLVIQGSCKYPPHNNNPLHPPKYHQMHTQAQNR